MKALAFLSLAMVVVPTTARAQIIEGNATAIDGDTIDMTGIRIRLLGLDAPEAEQTCVVNGETWSCGVDAAAALGLLINGEALSCLATNQDMYGRYLATCRTRLLDLGEQMVAQGLAVASDDAPDHYRTAEQRAKDLKLRLWASEFEQPSAWRAANTPAPTPAPQRAGASASTQPSSPPAYHNKHGCAIKGNRSRRGQWIYHLPGQQYYAQTRPEELFCTEAEARAAGYRRSRV